MRLHILLGTVALLAATATAGATDDARLRPLGVVELFTSQGCNSCPPADKIFADLVAGGEVVALAYHVDYWDYLGWKDTLATRENTERQQGYARSFDNRSVYTPQAVINGRTHVNGASRGDIDAALSGFSGAEKGLLVDVAARHEGESVIIEMAPAREGGVRNAHVVLVYYDPAQPIVIERGENKGQTVTYWNAVTGIQTAGMWHGEAERLELPASEIARKGQGGCAVLLQAVNPEGEPGAILGATLLDNTADK